MAFGSVATGNGTTIVFTTGGAGALPYATDGVLVSSIDFGEITREAIAYAGLAYDRERMFPGDLETARAITITGFLDEDAPENEWPQIWDEDTTDLTPIHTMVLTLPGADSYTDSGFMTSVQGPVLANNELMVTTMVFQTDNSSTVRWTAVA